jgi:hypothetical protein
MKKKKKKMKKSQRIQLSGMFEWPNIHTDTAKKCEKVNEEKKNVTYNASLQSAERKHRFSKAT